MNLAFLIILGSVLLFFGISAYQSNPNRKSTRYFFLTIILINVWMFSNYLSNTVSSFTFALLANRMIFTSTTLVMWSLFQFSKYYPDEKPTSTKSWGSIGALLTTIIALLGISPFIVQDITLQEGYSEIDFGWGIYPYVIHFIYSLILFIRELTFKYRASRGVERIKIQYLLIGLLLSVLGALVTNLLLPLIFNVFYLSNFGPSFLLTFVIFTFITIIRHRFLGIRFLVGQALHFISISLFILVGFFFFGWLFLLIFGSLFRSETVLLSLVVAPLFTFLFLKFNEKVGSFIRRRFIYVTFDPTESLSQFLRKTGTILDIEKITAELSTLSRNSFDVPDLSIHLFDKNSKELIFNKIHGYGINTDLSRNLTKIWNTLGKRQVITVDDLREDNSQKDLLLLMEESGTNLILSFGKNLSFEGFLTIGAKPSLAPYTTEELTFLTDLVSNSGVAIERAILYKEVQEFNVTLQQKVNTATAELKTRNKELEDLYDNLEELYQKEKDLMDIAGHEFRTPASILKNNLYLLKRRLEEMSPESLKDEKVEKYLKRLIEGTNRQIKLVNTFLESARIDNQRFEIQVEMKDIVEVVGDAVSDTKQFAREKDLQLFYEPPKQKIHAEIDLIRIREVIDNLLNNSIKYTSKGYIEVEVKDAGENVKISVKDSGVGIKEEDRALLFKKFSRVENYIGGEEGSIVRPGGTGLGLYVAKTIVDAHGGDIDVESDEGKGSKFIVTLPKNQPSYVRRVEGAKSKLLFSQPMIPRKRESVANTDTEEKEPQS